MDVDVDFGHGASQLLACLTRSLFNFYHSTVHVKPGLKSHGRPSANIFWARLQNGDFAEMRCWCKCCLDPTT